MKRLALVLIACATLGSAALAEKMDIETHTLVIDKLETVLPTLDGNEVGKTPIQIRLADLYSDRARLRAMEESEKNCGNKCHDSREDRKKALHYYELALKKAPATERDSIILQMAHLYDLTDQEKKSSVLLKRSIDEGLKWHSTSFLAQAYAGLGEAAYREGRSAEALKLYNHALSYKDCPKRGLISYRVAWCYLNNGSQKQAVETLVKILKTPELLARESSDGTQYDKSFAEDVSKDLATFLARGRVGAHEAQMLRELSPAEAVLDNTLYLGSEADRLGNKSGALYVYKIILGLELNPLQRLDALIHVAQIELDLGHKEQAIVEMEKVTAHWKKNGCQFDKDSGQSDADCKELQGHLRKMVTDWDRRSRKKYQEELAKAYALYVDLFKTDVEMQYWGGIVARDVKKAKLAIVFFHNASLLAADELKAGHDKKKFKNIFEGALLGEIEMAELDKDVNLRMAAYDHYLAMNPDGDHTIEVRYQKAEVTQEKKQNADAAIQFHDLALMKGQNKLQEQAADQALDILVDLKDDERIEKWATEFAGKFTSRRADFAKTARTASLKLVAKSAGAGSSDVHSAMRHLDGVSLVGASTDDQVNYYKTKLLLAEREHDLDETNRSADKLLKVKGLSEADRDYAMGRKVWVAESRLDFKSAFNLSKKMGLANLSDSERTLRLAMLAELAGLSAQHFYEEYLKNHHGAESMLILAKLIRTSKNPWVALKHNLGELKHHPDVLASLTLDLYLKTKDRVHANEMASVKGLISTTAGQTLAHLLFIGNYQELKGKLTQNRIPTHHDALIQKALEKRLDLIHQAEGFAQYAVNAQDWSLQVLALDLLERENRRLYSDILSLPAPRQLKGQQRVAYFDNVKRQSQPYLAKANDINSKLNEFRSNSRAIEQVADNFTQARPEARALAVTEMRLLADAGGPRVKREMDQVLASYNKKPSVHDLLLAREQVRRNPFDLRAVQNLKKTEEQFSGTDTMIVYLDARLDQMQSGGRK